MMGIAEMWLALVESPVVDRLWGHYVKQKSLVKLKVEILQMS
jgi:hypothetical protein